MTSWAILLTLSVLGVAVKAETMTISSNLARVIEDFDDGQVDLASYPGEDAHPDSWRLDSVITHNSSPYSLRLCGNTWKLEYINQVWVDSGDVWEAAAYIEEVGEVQGLGLVDSAHALFYAFAGTELLDPGDWVTVYQGSLPERQWNRFRLPVAEDWLERFGYLPVVTGVVFVNDRDTDPRASVYFDDIADITEDLPVAPLVEAWYDTGKTVDNGDGSWSVTVRFHSRVTDPDSREHEYRWFFGDDSTGNDSAPTHTYTVRDNHEYTVLLRVADSTALWGTDTCRVTVDPGPTTFPVRVNFVGDVMLARRYELPGGIIDTLGPEGIFQPTLPWLGDAADITIANLECPLTDEGVAHPTKPIVFRGRPANVVGLAYAGIDVVSLANNHTIDYGLEGLRETQLVLDSTGVAYSGAGANSYEAWQPAFAQKSGLGIAFLAVSDRNGQYDNYQPYLDAGYNKPGFAYLDCFHMRLAIEDARRSADLVIAEMHTGEEYQVAPADEDDESYSRFALVPAPGDTEERHRAIEAGADVVLCHHPHLLQGFEVYQGKLIAHSLGNFAFDQEYPETYPSVILNGLIDERGFYGFTLIPVHIDDYIPRRAQGELGLHILDYLARRSREMATYVIADQESVTARVVLDTSELQRWAQPYTEELPLAEAGGYWVSEPLRLRRSGSPCSVVSASPARDWEFRLGRDAVWFGGMEDEGATMWLLNQADEYYDTVAHQGLRSLCQLRRSGTGVMTTNLEERLVCYSDSTPLSIYAHVRTANAESAGVAFKCYAGRSGGSPIGTYDLGTWVSGTTDWTFYHRDFVPTDRTAFFDLWLQSRGPQSGEGQAWFDDAGVVEWDEWQPLDEPVSIPAPNDYYWVQVRTSQQTVRARLSYEEVIFEPPVAEREARALGPTRVTVRVLPSPTKSGAVISYELPRTAFVAVSIHDVLGREVRELASAPQAPGPHSVRWDLKDDEGRTVGAGTYFCRVRVGESVGTRRVVLSR